MTFLPPSLKVPTARWRLNIFVCVLFVMCYFWLIRLLAVEAWKAFCLGITAALLVTVLLFWATVTVGYPEVCGLVWKWPIGTVNGVRCCHCVTALIFFLPLSTPTDTVDSLWRPLSCGGFVKWTLFLNESVFLSLVLLTVMLFSLAGTQVQGVFYKLGLHPLITFLCREVIGWLLLSSFQIRKGKVSFSCWICANWI